MAEESRELRWGVERRLEFIEFRLYWEGGINRSDITSFFGVSVPQASKDLSLYEEMAPGNLSYDKSEKRYLASSKFKPRFFQPDPDRYLAQLRSIVDGLAPAAETWLGAAPDLGAMPIPHRRVDAPLLRSLLAAIRARRSIEILYQSMNAARPEPIWRWVTPHAFGSDGSRWHIRAFCHIDRKFKDFLLSRCLENGDQGEPGTDDREDTDWHTLIEIRLVPNPKLSDAQKTIIASEFEMTSSSTSVQVRKALLQYFNRRFRFDLIDKIDNPLEVPVVVENRAVFDKALAESMGRMGIF